jgi:hypothetical protein
MWIVYAKPLFGGPAQVLCYLGRYNHRIVISNHHLLAFDGDRVTFRHKDYAHGSKQRIMTLDAWSSCADSSSTCCPKARAHPPFRAALQPFPKPEPDAGTKAAGSRLGCQKCQSKSNAAIQGRHLLVIFMRFW